MQFRGVEVSAEMLETAAYVSPESLWLVTESLHLPVTKCTPRTLNSPHSASLDLFQLETSKRHRGLAAPSSFLTVPANKKFKYVDWSFAAIAVPMFRKVDFKCLFYHAPLEQMSILLCN